MYTQLPLYPRQRRLRRLVRDLPHSEQPQNRLAAYGAGALSDVELLALVIGTADARALADELLSRFESLHRLARAGAAQLMQTDGVGPALAARLVAAAEISRRLQLPAANEQVRIASPGDAAQLLLPRMRHLRQEELWVLILDTRNRVLSMPVIYRGSLNTSVVRVAEIFRPAVIEQAAAIIVAHNHPSGDPSPSPEDIHVTRQIVKAGQLFDITVLDHVVIGDGRYVSLKERNLAFD